MSEKNNDHLFGRGLLGKKKYFVNLVISQNENVHTQVKK